jgi:hypothetical protein
MSPDPPPKLSFWNIPPFRQRFRAAPQSIKIRGVRILVAAIFGMHYLRFGLEIPSICVTCADSILGASSPFANITLTAIPYALGTAIVSMVFCAIAAAGAAWYITGRAMQVRKHSRVRWAIWGALAAGAPMLSIIAIVSAEEVPFAFGVQVLLMLLGAGIGVSSCWVFQREQASHASESAVNSSS